MTNIEMTAEWRHDKVYVRSRSAQGSSLTLLDYFVLNTISRKVVTRVITIEHIPIIGQFKSAVKATVGSAMFNIIDKEIRFFDTFTLNEVPLVLKNSGTNMVLHANIFGSAIRKSVDITLNTLRDIFRGDYTPIVTALANGIKNAIPATYGCRARSHARWEVHSMATSGAFAQYYRNNPSYCPIAYWYKWTCGRYNWCGKECGVCGFWVWYPRFYCRCWGRRRWWGGCSCYISWHRRWIRYTCCPRYRYCCRYVPQAYTLNCWYVEWDSRKTHHHEVSLYAPTAGECSSTIARPELRYTRELFDTKDYKMYKHYVAENMWNAHSNRRRDQCNSWGWCSRRRTRRRRR
jgi:hypothetical protein